MTNLKRMRESMGMSQSELAKRSGVNIRMIQHYEQGQKDIDHAWAIRVVRLAEALDCGIKDIMNTR